MGITSKCGHPTLQEHSEAANSLQSADVDFEKNLRSQPVITGWLRTACTDLLAPQRTAMTESMTTSARSKCAKSAAIALAQHFIHSHKLPQQCAHNLSRHSTELAGSTKQVRLRRPKQLRHLSCLRAP